MYAVGVIAGLIAFGHVSDWVRRKRVLLAGVVVEVIACLFFVESTGLPMLIVGRLVSGIGIGAVTATSMAYLHELHDKARPAAGRGRFDTVSGIANLGGLGAGALIAGALAQWARRPLLTRRRAIPDVRGNLMVDPGFTLWGTAVSRASGAATRGRGRPSVRRSAC
ncbi:MFS transporter (plasmid) [Streptomyces sp. NBC_00984]|uniref:MFS transporter n=1 Tax=Streptomyces sp. NBC_00984 TaxID=2903700 RepID=UPI00386416DE|nr:MFS transporter [Streptomyces sp. NBC_00984]